MVPTETERTRYEIVVRGRMTGRLGSAFEGLELEPRPGATALTGSFPIRPRRTASWIAFAISGSSW
jgi:hypothetical protein